MSSSDIQVFVRWKDQTIFAGEDVECTITFRNVAESNNPDSNNHSGQLTPLQSQRKQPRTGNSDSSSFFSLKSPQNIFFGSGRRSNSTSPHKNSSHRISSSLSASHSFPPPSTPRVGPPPGHKHKRSVSILSIDSEGGGGGGGKGGTGAGAGAGGTGGAGGGGGDRTPSSSSPFSRTRPPRGHGRSASLQVLPRRNESHDEAFAKGRNSTRGLPTPDSPINPRPGNLRVEVNHRAGSGAPSPIRLNEPSRVPARKPQLPPIDFKFPAAPPPSNETNNIRSAISPSTVSTDEAASSATSAKPPGSSLPAQGHLPQMTRIMSTSSLSGSHRSSGEFYSASNHSSETLQSEYTNYSTPAPRAIPRRHMRHHSSIDPSPILANSQSLLMGYAQVSASFTVDGSLINQSAFEDVKRKGVVGSQGSGTPGPPSSRAPRGDKGRKGGGFWGALRWNNIEESLSGLLANNELDGLREMRGVSSSKSIPLLSTSQSLLFVDLRLAPGEEQSYSFSFTLPSGLPASHKGKAIKISYNLVIGTQRPSGPNEPQRVNRINVPFRVFSGVNGQGQILGHNLMFPYVLLRDEARVQKVGPGPSPVWKQKSLSSPIWTSAPEFLSYVDEILEQRSRGNSLQPPDTPAEKREIHSVSNTALSCKDAIDLAVLRSNQAAHSSQSPNRFEIARNGRRIAVVVLNRPAHRLGETIIATVDFTDAALPCYALRATLETSEKVAGDLAVRSNASIYRATRRIHASFFENTLYSTRVVFTPAVPISATPTVLTSGVNHQWELRLEFVTPTSMHGEADTPPSGAGLLETISQDDRGQVMSALENLGCDSFEIGIPLTVYGETVRERLPEENEGYSI